MRTLFARLLGRARVAILGQALCLALSAYTLALAAALHAGAELGTLGAHGAALVAALAVGWAWCAEHPLDTAAVLRRADSKLRLRGALVAAFEEEGRNPEGAFAALATRRVLGVAPPKLLREAAHAHTVPFAAAPLVGVVVLALVSATAAARRARADVEGGQLAFLAAQQMTVALRTASRAGALTPEQVGTLSRLQTEARAIGVAAEVDEAPPSKSDGERASRDDAERAAELARAADALAAELAHAPEAAREALARAAQALDTHALRRELRPLPVGAPRAGPGPDPGAGQPGGAMGLEPGPEEGPEVGPEVGPELGGEVPPLDDPAGTRAESTAATDLADATAATDLADATAATDLADGAAGERSSAPPDGARPGKAVTAEAPGARNGTRREGDVTDTPPDVTMQGSPSQALGSADATRTGDEGTGEPPASADPVEAARPNRPSGPREAQPAVAVGRPWSRRYDALVASWAARRAPTPPPDPPETPPQ